MKELYLVLKSGPEALHTLEVLKAHGFHGTVISSGSLRTMTEDEPEEHHFFNLRHYEKGMSPASLVCLFLLSEEKTEEAKELIRNTTDDFKAIKGAMYSQDIPDYEGSI